MVHSVKSFGGILTLMTIVAVAAGCRSDSPAAYNTGFGDDAANQNSSGAEGQSTDFGTQTSGLPNVDDEFLERTLWDSETGLETVYFDYNSFALSDSAREKLRRNAEKIKLTRSAMIQIEGHCDERGTQEYNLALGEKRALAVREYLVSLGVAPSRLITISYGEEMPAVQGSGEAVWSQNRRAEFNRAM